MWTKKVPILTSFFFRNLMLSFVFTYDPRKLQKLHLKK